MRIRGSAAAICRGTFLCIFLLLASAIAEYAPFGDADHLTKLTEMQFHRGQDTSYKRSSPIPQLRCVKGCEYEPATVQCTNIKPHGKNSKWKCETDLPGHLKFDETTIVCEGFESAADDKVLRGSCGLEYSLTRNGWSPLQGQHYKHYEVIAYEDQLKGWTASWLIVFGVVFYLIQRNWRAYRSPDANANRAAQDSRLSSIQFLRSVSGSQSQPIVQQNMSGR